MDIPYRKNSFKRVNSYWKTQLSNLLLSMTNLNPSIQRLEEELDIPHQIRNNRMTIPQLKTTISLARSKLTAIQKDARRHREEWLQEKALEAAQDQNISVEQAITNMASREKTKRTYS